MKCSGYTNQEENIQKSKLMNKVLLIGRLGSDPFLVQAGETTVCNTSIATSEKSKDGSEVTEWHRCVFFGKAAEAMAKYAKKGTHIYIEGKHRTRTYDKDGQRRYVTEVIVISFEFLGGIVKPHTGGQDFRNDPSVQTAYGSVADDLPF